MYGLDLRDVLWGSSPVGVRRLFSLISELPTGSATSRVLADGWDQDKELLATIADLISLSNHMYLTSHVEKGTRVPEPMRFPRPRGAETIEEAKQPALSPKDDVRAFFLEHGEPVVWTEPGVEKETE